MAEDAVKSDRCRCSAMTKEEIRFWIVSAQKLWRRCQPAMVGYVR